MRALFVVAVAAVAGCGGSPRPRAPGSPSVASDTRRVVLEPDAVAFVFDQDEEGERPAAPLGAKIGARARLLLRFPRPEVTGTLARAWLVLDRAPGAQAGPGDVTVRADAIVEPWSIAGGAGTRWASPPKSERIEGATTITPPRTPTPIRIDVTAWVERLMKKGPRPWGLRVEGSGDGFGVPIATGAGEGAPPRLEIYLSP